jgi:hypothetical protein
MTVKIGSYEFDHVDYDAKGDVLYLAEHTTRPRRAQPWQRPKGTRCSSTRQVK